MKVTGTGIAVALAVIIAMGFLFFGPTFFGLFTSPQATDSVMEPISFDQNAAPQDLPTELTVTDTTEGSGKEAQPGTSVTVNYVGMLPDGSVFDESTNRGPFTFNLGAGMVIPGWEQGIVGMKEGGKRRLIIPSDMAYGAAGVPGAIPPNATLIFDVELLSVQ